MGKSRSIQMKVVVEKVSAFGFLFRFPNILATYDKNTRILFSRQSLLKNAVISKNIILYKRFRPQKQYEQKRYDKLFSTKRMIKYVQFDIYNMNLEKFSCTRHVSESIELKEVREQNT